MLKDHYKTLEVAPNASQKEIKKSFRRLALLYHPDKHSDHRLAHMQFLQLQEAYEVLKDERSRKAYDHERWLLGNFNQVYQAFTPDFLISELEQLQRHLATINLYRLNHGLLRDYLLYQLGDEKMGILHMTAGAEKIARIQQLYLHAGAFLSLRDYKQVLTRLKILVVGFPENLDVLEQEERRVIKKLGIQKKLPWIFVLLTMLLCLAMYFYGRAK